MNIEEIAKEYTREEFLKEYAKPYYCGDRLMKFKIKCNTDITCEECVKEAVKDIKFKGEEEEIFEAECIDSSGKVCLTKGKIYPVKQSQYDNHYVLTNDSGTIDDYFKTRFRILEGEKMEDKKIKVRCIKSGGFENKLKENEEYTVVREKDGRYILKELGEAYEFGCERFEKVEDKTIKVRCIKKNEKDPLSTKELIINKEYPVLEESKNCYLILNDKDSNDTWYSKELFMVECVNNTGYEKELIINKKYPVLEEDANFYFIKDERFEDKVGYKKDRFKLVEENLKIIKLKDENYKFKKENEDLIKRNQLLEEGIKELKEQIGKTLSNGDKFFDELKAKIKELEKTKEHYQAVIDEREKENLILADDIEKLKKLNNQGYMEQMNRTLNEKNEEIKKINGLLENEQIANSILDDEAKDLRQQIERLGKSTNEYYYNWLETQKERDEATDLNRILKDKVEALKESVISLTELI